MFENDFRNSTFYLDDLVMETNEMNQKYFFPVADSCNKTGDPSTGCYYSDSVYHSFNYTTNGDFFNITISDGSMNPILHDQVSVKDVSHLSQRQLSCWDRESCTQSCHNVAGEWSIYSNECIITHHLNSICYRVFPSNDSYVIDHSS